MNMYVVYWYFFVNYMQYELVLLDDLMSQPGSASIHYASRAS